LSRQLKPDTVFKEFVQVGIITKEQLLPLKTGFETFDKFNKETAPTPPVSQPTQIQTDLQPSNALAPASAKPPASIPQTGAQSKKSLAPIPKAKPSPKSKKPTSKSLAAASITVEEAQKIIESNPNTVNGWFIRMFQDYALENMSPDLVKKVADAVKPFETQGIEVLEKEVTRLFGPQDVEMVRLRAREKVQRFNQMVEAKKAADVGLEEGLKKGRGKGKKKVVSPSKKMTGKVDLSKSTGGHGSASDGTVISAPTHIPTPSNGPLNTQPQNGTSTNGPVVPNSNTGGNLSSNQTPTPIVNTAKRTPSKSRKTQIIAHRLPDRSLHDLTPQIQAWPTSEIARNIIIAAGRPLVEPNGPPGSRPNDPLSAKARYNSALGIEGWS